MSAFEAIKNRKVLTIGSIWNGLPK